MTALKNVYDAILAHDAWPNFVAIPIQDLIQTLGVEIEYAERDLDGEAKRNKEHREEIRAAIMVATCRLYQSWSDPPQMLITNTADQLYAWVTKE